jgi:hypothetical protein
LFLGQEKSLYAFLRKTLENGRIYIFVLGLKIRKAGGNMKAHQKCVGQI